MRIPRSAFGCAWDQSGWIHAHEIQDSHEQADTEQHRYEVLESTGVVRGIEEKVIVALNGGDACFEVAVSAQLQVLEPNSPSRVPVANSAMHLPISVGP